MGSWDFLNYVPVASNIKGAIEGDPYQAIGGPLAPLGGEALAKKALGGSNLTGPPTTNLQNTGTQAVQDAGVYRGLNTPGTEAGLTQSYQDTISGKNPSVAMSALQQQTAQNAQQQLGFASGLGGLNASLARRSAAENIGRQNQAAIGQGVQTRAQEIANAQQGLAGEAKTQGEQQLTEQQLAEKAYADQLESQNRTREGNMKAAGGLLSGLGSALGI